MLSKAPSEARRGVFYFIGLGAYTASIRGLHFIKTELYIHAFWGPVKSGGHYVRGEVVELLDEEEEEDR